jgi:hypothetical protein
VHTQVSRKKGVIISEVTAMVIQAKMEYTFRKNMIEISLRAEKYDKARKF